MNNIMRLIVLIICLLPLGSVHGQELSFKSTTHDFGVIAEDGGEVTTTFEFSNSGDSPLVIVSASSSCGCTTPLYSRRPIMAGESSTIEVTFDPAGRPGQFTKTISFVVAPTSDKYILTIVGDVTPREKTTQELYPFDMGGGFRMGANYYPLSHVGQAQRVEGVVPYINTSKRAIKVELAPVSASGYLQYELPTTLEAGQSGNIIVSYDLTEHPELYGALSDKYSVSINGKESKYNLMVTAHAIDHFSDEERETPPITNVSPRLITMGELEKSGLSAKSTYIIENTGVSDLIVRALDLGSGVYSSIQSGMVVEAGAQQEFQVWIDTEQIGYGTFSRYIILTVNDPYVPVQRVRVAGTVVQK